MNDARDMVRGADEAVAFRAPGSARTTIAAAPPVRSPQGFGERKKRPIQVDRSIPDRAVSLAVKSIVLPGRPDGPPGAPTRARRGDRPARPGIWPRGVPIGIGAVAARSGRGDGKNSRSSRICIGWRLRTRMTPRRTGSADRAERYDDEKMRDARRGTNGAMAWHAGETAGLPRTPRRAERALPPAERSPSEVERSALERRLSRWYRSRRCCCRRWRRCCRRPGCS
jgi:hypothetical protein